MSSTEDAALKLIQDHGYKPPIDVVAVANDLGIEVRIENLEPQVSGVLVRNGERAIMVINDRHHSNRQRFTIAHECAHFHLEHKNNIFIDSATVFFRRDDIQFDPQETAANTFAAALLMPEPDIRELVREPIDAFDDIAIQRLAAHFEVSIQALTIRLLKLKLLTSWE